MIDLSKKEGMIQYITEAPPDVLKRAVDPLLKDTEHLDPKIIRECLKTIINWAKTPARMKQIEKAFRDALIPLN